MHIKQICVLVSFKKTTMKKEMKKLQEAYDNTLKDNTMLMNLIKEKNEKIRSLEKTICMLNDDTAAAQKKSDRLEAELNEVQTVMESIAAQLAQLSEIHEEKQKINLTLDPDSLRDSLKYIAISASALTSLLLIRKIL